MTRLWDELGCVSVDTFERFDTLTIDIAEVCSKDGYPQPGLEPSEGDLATLWERIHRFVQDDLCVSHYGNHKSYTVLKGLFSQEDPFNV
jgi:hypothetical protein